MKRYSLFLAAVISVAMLPLYSQADSVVIVNTIRVIVDGKEFSWKDGATAFVPAGASVKEEETIIRPQTVLSYSKLKPGKAISLHRLEKEAVQIKVRLENSGLFYTVSVDIVPPKKYPDKRSVVISVSTGFLYRLGAGNAYGVFGKDGLAGLRAGFRLYAGWNKNGGELYIDNAFGLPVILGARAFWNGPASIVNKKLENLN